MTKHQAHKLLNKQKANEPVPQFLINYALQSTGDLPRDFAMVFETGNDAWMEGICLERDTKFEQ